MRLWYRHAYVHFEAPLPKDGPIIFACTHPNSAVDYLFAPLIHHMPTNVLVRGDVFEHPILNKIFRQLFMLPVYRFRDGYASINRNQDSFKACYETFDEHGRVLIFSEGICFQQKVLQPLRKGTARLALDYLRKHGGERIYVVPIAGSYTRFRQFRSSVMINYGKAIDARDYLEIYDQNANKAYEKLTKDIEDQLARTYVTIPDYSDNADEEKVLMASRLGRSTGSSTWQVDDQQTLIREKQLTQDMAEGRLDAKPISEEVERYAVTAWDDGLLSRSSSPWMSLIYLAALAPFILLFGLSVLLPYALGRLTMARWIDDIIFDNTVMVMGGALVYVIQLIFLGIIGTLIWGWIGLILPFGVLLITLSGLEVVDEFILHWRRWSHRDQLDSLRTLADQFVD